MLLTFAGQHVSREAQQRASTYVSNWQFVIIKAIMRKGEACTQERLGCGLQGHHPGALRRLQEHLHEALAQQAQALLAPLACKQAGMEPCMGICCEL